MKRLLLLLALGTLVCGFTPGLKVKYGSGSAADKNYFYNVPRTINEIKSLGWRETQGPPGPFPDLKLYCPLGRIICVYFHPLTEFVAGVQTALPVEQYQWAVIKPEKYFVLWHAPGNDDEPATDYWTMSQYYVAPDSNGPTKENGATLQQGNVWLDGPDGKLMKIPENVAELKTTKYKRQNCVPNMGTHYYYNMSSELECDELYPYYLLATDERVQGIGFEALGQASKLPFGKDWLQNYNDSKNTFRSIAPDSPDCIADNMEKYGAMSTHVYFIEEPWTMQQVVFRLQIYYLDGIANTPPFPLDSTFSNEGED